MDISGQDNGTEQPASLCWSATVPGRDPWAWCKSAPATPGTLFVLADEPQPLHPNEIPLTQGRVEGCSGQSTARSARPGFRLDWLTVPSLVRRPRRGSRVQCSWRWNLRPPAPPPQVGLPARRPLGVRAQGLTGGGFRPSPVEGGEESLKTTPDHYRLADCLRSHMLTDRDHTRDCGWWIMICPPRNPRLRTTRTAARCRRGQHRSVG
jgi:hypothetical protein